MAVRAEPGNAEGAFEGAAEGGFGGVADATSGFGGGEAAVHDQAAGDLHAPPGDIGQGGLDPRAR